MVLLLAMLALGSTWFVVSRLNVSSSELEAAKRARNAQVLARAKQAIVGHVARVAATSGEDNPGRFPCPEAPGSIGSTSEGIASGACTLPAIGRLPWKTLGLDMLTDSAAEPLWYVVSPGWAYTSADLVINSNTQGQLALDGQTNAAVALIIAPGRALSVQASAGCTARVQARMPPSPAINPLDYLECYSGASFVSTGPRTSFNDQVIAVTTADVLPAIEAAIAKRIEREIVPLLAALYAPTNWGLGGTAARYPLPAAFDPQSTTPASFVGQAPNGPGQLPLNFGEGCTAGTSRCNLVGWTALPSAIKASGFGSIRATDPSNTLPWGTTVPCQWDPADTAAVLCEGEFRQDSTNPAGAMRIELTATATSVGTGLRVLHARVEARDDVALGSWTAMSHDVATSMNGADGSATITIGATLPVIDCAPPACVDWGTYAQYRVRLKVSDHALTATAPKQLAFDSGTSAEIRPGQTIAGASSGASGRVLQVDVSSGAWDASPGAAGSLVLYGVSGSFQLNEDLHVQGVARARATSSAASVPNDVSWFARNEWYRHLYYAVADGFVWGGAGTCNASTCLQVMNLPADSDETIQRALFLLMGRPLATLGQDQSASIAPSLTDYLDSAVNQDGDGTFERSAVNRMFNDRFISISKN